MEDVNNLIAIKSIFELNQGYNDLNILLANISDRNFAQKISNEVKRRNFGNITLMIERYLFDNIQNSVVYYLKDIKQFDFDYLENTNLTQIKAKLGVSELKFYTATTIDGKDTLFYRHWDDLNRFAVVIEKELVNEIKSNYEISLNLFKELVIAKLGYYTKFNIEKYDPNSAKTSDSKDDVHYESQTFEDYNGTHAQDYVGYSDQEINNIFDGDPGLYWNID